MLIPHLLVPALRLSVKSNSAQYIGLPITPKGGPRFEFAMFLGKPAIMRKEDQVIVARFVSPTDRPTILSFLALFNRGHFEESGNFEIVTKLSETKKQRLENIRAIHRNIQRGIVFAEKNDFVLGYSEMSEEDFWAMFKSFKDNKAFDAERVLRSRYGNKNYYSPFEGRKR